MSNTKALTNQTYLNHMFIVRLNPELGIPEFQAKSVTRPNWNASTGWMPIEIEFIEFIGYPNSTKLIEFISKTNSADGFPLNFSIDLLDPVGEAMTVLEIKGELSSLDFSVLSYDNSDLCTFKITVQVKELQHILS